MDQQHAADSSAEIQTIGPPSDDVHEEVAEREIILYREANDMVVTLNETGSAVWTLCDGTRTLGTLIDDVAEAYRVGAGDVAGDVTALVAELQEAGFLPG